MMSSLVDIELAYVRRHDTAYADKNRLSRLVVGSILAVLNRILSPPALLR